MTHLKDENGRRHAGAAGETEKRQGGEIRQSPGIYKYETVSERFMFTLNDMLSLNHCCGTDWIYSSHKNTFYNNGFFFLLRNRGGGGRKIRTIF